MTAPPEHPFSDLARKRFASFVTRSLRRARERGLTDRKIAATTGVGTSTFHRWRRAEGRELPELDRVRAFCVGVDADFGEALTALGLQPGSDNPAPEPPLPREVKIILRAIGDPNVPDAEKLVYREMLLMLAERAQAAMSRARSRGREAS